MTKVLFKPVKRAKLLGCIVTVWADNRAKLFGSEFKVWDASPMQFDIVTLQVCAQGPGHGEHRLAHKIADGYSWPSLQLHTTTTITTIITINHR